MLRGKKIYSLIIVVGMLIFLNGFFGNNTLVLADTGWSDEELMEYYNKQKESRVSGKTAGSGVEIPTSSEIGLSDAGIADILSNILMWMLGVVGIVALIGFVISGLQYILSAGNEKMAETGKRNMTYSIIGVIVVLGAFVIVQAIDRMLNANSF